MSEGHSLDFGSLSSDELQKLVSAINAISSYNIERKEIGESIKEVLETLCFEMKADKDSAKYVKRFVRKAATVHANNKLDDVRYENEVVDLLLDSVNRKSVEPEED